MLELLYPEQEGFVDFTVRDANPPQALLHGGVYQTAGTRRAFTRPCEDVLDHGAALLYKVVHRLLDPLARDGRGPYLQEDQTFQRVQHKLLPVERFVSLMITRNRGTGRSQCPARGLLRPSRLRGLSLAYPGPSSAPGFVEAQGGRGYEDGAVGTGGDANEEGEGKVTQGGLAEEEEGGYRDQGTHRCVDRTHHHLPDGVVRQLIVAATVVAGLGGVLPYPVEDDDRIVQGVTQNRQDRDHRHEVHLAPDQSVEAYRDEDVVQESDHRCEGEGELEAEGDKDDDDEERHPYGLQGLPPDLATKRRADARGADLRPELLLQRLPDLSVLFLREHRRAYLVAVLAELLYKRPFAKVSRK